jgi:hypothetical protein
VIARLSAAVDDAVGQSATRTAWGVGLTTAVADNTANNLPVGLLAGSVAANDHLPTSVVGAMLIGVDLGWFACDHPVAGGSAGGKDRRRRLALSEARPF